MMILTIEMLAVMEQEEHTVQKAEMVVIFGHQPKI